jgi:hypothetical protein
LNGMTTFCQSDSTIIDRARIRSRFRDGLAAQRRIGHLLRSAALSPSALPPSAILIVRTFHSQEPATGWLNYKSIYLPTEWQESATRDLDKLAARAARPAWAFVPGSAQAVLFADYAELLACLAQDWLHGNLRTNWWWSTFLKHSTPEESVCHEWMQSPEFLPAALEILAARQCAAVFVQRLRDPVVLRLLDDVVTSFAVPRQAQADDSLESSTLSMEKHVTKQADESWLPLVPEAVTRDLAPAKRILLAQGLMLRRAPALARAFSFQQQLARWWLWEEHVDELYAEQEPRAEEESDEARATIASKNSALYAPPLPSDQQSNAMPLAADRIQDVRTSWDISVPPSEFATTKIPDLTMPGPHAVDPVACEKTIEAFPLTTPSSIQTAFGGIFFLLNVALGLKLYADFTCPRGGNLELDVWDFLYLLGGRFVSPEKHAEAVFDLLTKLSGRTTGQEPGEHFDPPDNWRVPPEWLSAFPEPFEQQEVVCEGRRRLYHPAGFLVSDEACDSAIPPTKPLQRWLNWITAYVEARLKRALGREDAARFLCSIPARVDFTSTHLDVTYPLDLYPVEIRTAGLDRDPGWIPAAGRFVAFHFE